jgi:hypothetical protein
VSHVLFWAAIGTAIGIAIDLVAAYLWLIFAPDDREFPF